MRERNIVGVMINGPFVSATADMTGPWCHHIAAVASGIETGAKEPDAITKATIMRHRKAKENVLATAARDRTHRVRQLAVFGLQGPQAVIAVMADVNVQHKQTRPCPGDNADVGVRP